MSARVGLRLRRWLVSMPLRSRSFAVAASASPSEFYRRELPQETVTFASLGKTGADTRLQLLFSASYLSPFFLCLYRGPAPFFRGARSGTHGMLLPARSSVPHPGRARLLRLVSLAACRAVPYINNINQSHHATPCPALFSLSPAAHTYRSTLVMVLNALAIDPRRPWKGPWRWYSESMVGVFVSC